MSNKNQWEEKNQNANQNEFKLNTCEARSQASQKATKTQNGEKQDEQ